MKIALCQINTTIGDLEGNANKVLEYYEMARANGADLAVFPELSLTGYIPGDMLAYNSFVDKQVRLLEMTITPKIAKDCAIIIGGITHNYWSGKAYFNSAIFITNGRIEYVTNKSLIPVYDLFNEERYFERGTQQIPFEYKGQRIGLSVCEDMWRGEGTVFNKLYKENPIEKLMYDGADILINISASPFYRDKDQRRHQLLAKYSKKWKVPFIMVNAVGANASVIFDGRSKVYGPDGNCVMEAKAFKEDFLIYDTDAKVDRECIREQNETEIVRRGIVLGIRDYLNKQNFEQLVIGMSGGIDSALVATLAVQAVGAENVHCINMPTRFSSKGSIDDSEKLCKNLGVELVTVPIERLFQGYMDIFGTLWDETNSLTMENIQARIRGNILMAYTNNLRKALLLTTGNKSEIAVGYNTLYGDTNGAFTPIGDLYKTQVYELASWINKDREIIPKSILEKAPSAELNVDQKDQDTLPEYDLLDTVLMNYINKEKTPQEIVDMTNIPETTVNWIVNKVETARYKRYQLPPILKVSRKSFETDRKWPIVYKTDWLFSKAREE